MENSCLEFKFRWLIPGMGPGFVGPEVYITSGASFCFFNPRIQILSIKLGTASSASQAAPSWLQSQDAFAHKRLRTAVSTCAGVWLPFIFTNCHNLRIFFFFWLLKAHFQADPHIKAQGGFNMAGGVSLGSSLPLHCSDVTYLISRVAGSSVW